MRKEYDVLFILALSIVVVFCVFAPFLSQVQ
jgi:hypothetical protein